jgi:hypothetical protein
MNSDDKAHAIVWGAFWAFMAVVVICLTVNATNDNPGPPQKTEDAIFIEECTRRGGSPKISSSGGFSPVRDYDCRK